MNQGASRISQALTHWGAYDVEAVGEDVKSIRPFRDDLEPSRIGQSMTKSRSRSPSVRRGWLDGQPGSHAATDLGSMFAAVRFEQESHLAPNGVIQEFTYGLFERQRDP